MSPRWCPQIACIVWPTVQKWKWIHNRGTEMRKKKLQNAISLYPVIPRRTLASHPLSKWGLILSPLIHLTISHHICGFGPDEHNSQTHWCYDGDPGNNHSSKIPLVSHSLWWEKTELAPIKMVVLRTVWKQKDGSWYRCAKRYTLID